MKKLLPLLFIFGSIQYAIGQITTPITKANFGIEADLSSNYFNNALQPTGDDWFSNGHTGSGDFIIDTSGAASILAGYNSNPATRMLSFSRLMRQAPYTVLSNKLLLDAVFHRDFHGDDSTVFANGSNKNGMTPADWSCPVAQGIPDKNDILDAYTHVRRDGTNASDSLWMFGGLSLENTTGSRYFDFELYQTDIIYNRSTQTFGGYGPDAGHTTWVFDAAGNIVTPGDIIFTAEFSSSSLTLVEARIWIRKTSLSTTPVTFNWGGDFDGDGSGAVYGYANILPKTAGTFYTGIQNTAATWAGPFSLVRVDNSVTNDYIAKQFMEFSVNLTKLGIEPASFSGNGCGSPFRRVLIKSRSSTSFTSELKDFIGPFKMFDYPKVDANAFINYFCGTMPVAAIDVYNPMANSTYTWTTNNGSIVGANTGTSITVNAPGTYYVTQQLHVQCPVFATDSVTLLYDAVCAVLDVNVTDFLGDQRGKNAALKWQVSNNELAAYYVIEYGAGNQIFKELATINANGKVGKAGYDFLHLLNNIEPVTTYRIKVVGKNGAVKYSPMIVFSSNSDKKKQPVIFPNPTNGKAWISVESSEKTSMRLCILDMTGRLIKTIDVRVNQGNNLLPLSMPAALKDAIYIVKIKSTDGETIQKLTLVK